MFRGKEGEGLELTAIQGAMENKWFRNRIEIVNSTYLDQYSLVFQVTVGPEFTGNVALDDVVFSPECRLELPIVTFYQRSCSMIQNIRSSPTFNFLGGYLR